MAKPFKTLIQEIADLCAKCTTAILPYYYQKLPLEIRNKENQTPLSNADLIAHELLNNHLKNIINAPIVSEESGAHHAQNNPFWLIDPIDGTKQFIKGEKGFCIAIAYIEAHRPILSLIYAPLSNEYWYAGKGEGAYKKSKCQTEKRLYCRPIPNIPTIISAHKNLSPKAQQFLNTHFQNHHHITQGSALKFCQIAEGNADFYFKFSNKSSQWDTAAGELILEEAGGALRYFPMQILEYGKQKTYQNPPFIAYGKNIEEAQIAHYFSSPMFQQTQ